MMEDMWSLHFENDVGKWVFLLLDCLAILGILTLWEKRLKLKIWGITDLFEKLIQSMDPSLENACTRLWGLLPGVPIPDTCISSCSLPSFLPSSSYLPSEWEQTMTRIKAQSKEVSRMEPEAERSTICRWGGRRMEVCWRVKQSLGNIQGGWQLWKEWQPAMGWLPRRAE